jgi:ATP-dependent DNA ligase
MQLLELYDGHFEHPMIIERKHDGVRCVIELRDDGQHSIKTREGQDLSESARCIADELYSIVGHAIIFDGELAAPTYVETMQQLTERPRTMRYHVFDIVEPGTQLERKRHLDTLLPSRMRWSRRVSWRIVKSLHTVRKAYVRAIKAGHEGLVIKEPDAQREEWRSYAWCKIKPGAGDAWV